MWLHKEWGTAQPEEGVLSLLALPFSVNLWSWNIPDKELCELILAHTGHILGGWVCGIKSFSRVCSGWIHCSSLALGSVFPGRPGTTTAHCSLALNGLFSCPCWGRTISLPLTLLHLLFPASPLKGSQDFRLISPQVQGMYWNIFPGPSAALGLAEDSMSWGVCTSTPTLNTS